MGTRADVGRLRVLRAPAWVALGAVFWLGQACGQTLTIGRHEGSGILVEASVQVVREAFRLAGLNLVFRPLPLGRLIESADSGEVDGDLQRIGELPPEFTHLVKVPTPINRVGVAVYGVSPDLASKSRAEISRMRGVIQRSVFVLTKHTQGMTVTAAQNTVAALEMVRNGHADVAILVREDSEVRLREAGSTDVVRWPQLWASEPLYLWLNRKHAALVPKLNDALQRLQRQGFIERAHADMLRKNAVPLLQGENP